MRPLRYSINVTLDGCCDHRVMVADEDLHRHAVENLDQADALLFGRVTYEMMEAAWRVLPGRGTKVLPGRGRPDWMEPFARTIDAAKKYVVSSTLDLVDWNAELVRGDLGKAVQQLKQESGKGLFLGGVKLPLALAELGLIDEYYYHYLFFDNGPLISVAYGNGSFVAVGNGISVTSQDGLAWTRHLPRDTNFNVLSLGQLVYGGGRFVAGGWGAWGSPSISIDGINWVASSNRFVNGLGIISYGNGQFVGVSSDRTVYSSENGDTWAALGAGLPQVAVPEGTRFGPRALMFENGKFFSAGTAGEILSSPDGLEWQRQTDGPNARLAGIAHGDSKFVAVGENGTILYSADGESWSQASAEATNDLNCVAYGATNFVAGGRYGTVLTSNDGTNWMAPQSLGPRDMAAITFGQGRFVAVANTDGYDMGYPGGLIYTSIDGQNWQLAARNDFYTYTAVTFGNGKFLAVATSDTDAALMVSTDGTNWTQLDNCFPAFSAVRYIAFGKDRFVATGGFGDTFVSFDGNNWHRRYVKAFGGDWPFSISYGNGRFFITELSGAVWVSPSGINWTRQETGTIGCLYGIGYGNDSCVGVGDFGMILQNRMHTK